MKTRKNPTYSGLILNTKMKLSNGEEYSLICEFSIVSTQRGDVVLVNSGYADIDEQDFYYDKPADYYQQALNLFNKDNYYSLIDLLKVDEGEMLAYDGYDSKTIFYENGKLDSLPSRHFARDMAILVQIFENKDEIMRAARLGAKKFKSVVDFDIKEYRGDMELTAKTKKLVAVDI